MNGVLSDIQIEDLCVVKHGNPMITPFQSEQIRLIENPSQFVTLVQDGQGINRRLGPWTRRINVIPKRFQAFEERRKEHRRIGPNMIRAISFGVCSYGYDLTLSPGDFRVFHNVHSGRVLVDPKNFDERLLMKVEPNVDESGTWFTIPGNSYALAKTIEYIRMPRDLTAISVGKSTYARCGIITNVTPFEAGWAGEVTLELANACPAPVKVYANEGICQTVFFRGSVWPRVSYADRAGKYHNQVGLTLAKV